MMFACIMSARRYALRDKDRFSKECDSIKAKNSSNLTQTQEGIKAFKEQIESLKTEVRDEKEKAKEAKKAIDSATKEAGKKAEKEAELDARVKDLEDKWAKSKRINQQRKDKVEELEKQLKEAKEAKSAGNWKAAPAKANAGESEAAKKKYEALEEEYVTLKARLTTENEDLLTQLQVPFFELYCHLLIRLFL